MGESKAGPPNGTHESKSNPNPADVSRRSFMQSLGLTAAAGAIAPTVDAATSSWSSVDTEPKIFGPDPINTTLRVNGRPVRVEFDPSTTLLEALRFHMDLTGSKEICGRGACGGCSVMVDGQVIASCMMLAYDAIGKDVTTVEGMSAGGRLDDVQESFIRHDALQCGYCTPGFIVAAKALLNENAKPTVNEIKAGMAGNYCRCGCHSNVINAVLDASGQTPLNEK